MLAGGERNRCRFFLIVVTGRLLGISGTEVAEESSVNGFVPLLIAPSVIDVAEVDMFFAIVDSGLY